MRDHETVTPLPQEQKDRRLLLLFGITGFVVVLVCYLTLGGRHGSRDLERDRDGVHAVGGTTGLETPRFDSARGFVDGEPIQLGAADVEETPQTTAHILANILSRDSTLDSNLSLWEAVDWFSFGLADELRTAGVTQADGPQLITILEGAHSTGLRQFLLVSLGALETETVAELAESFLREPGMTASSAYALGRSGSPRSIAVILEELAQPGRKRADLEALYFGLAQAGPEALPHLLAATETWLLQGASLGDPLPLSFVRSPAMRGKLQELALQPGHPALRAAAIRGFIESCRSEKPESSEVEWLHGLAEGAAQDVALRIEALRGLVLLDPAGNQEIIGTLLGQAGLQPELLHAALEASRTSGIPPQHVDLLIQLALDGSDSGTSSKAVRALAAATDPETQRRLAELIPRLDVHERNALLLQLAARDHQPHGVRSTTPLAPELIEALTGLLADPLLEPSDQYQTLQLLKGVEGLEDEVLQRARLLYQDASPEERPHQLMLAAQILGSEMNGELVHSFREADGFLSHLEAAATLVSIPENLDSPEIVDFLQDEVLPFLRTSLPANTGATLAYLDPKRSISSHLGVLATGIFGRHGKRSDVDLLESLGPAFLENQSAWPAELREAVHTSLTEAAARASDLIELRLGEAE